MSESDIPMEDPTRDTTTDVATDGTLAQPTPEYHEDEAAELEIAIKMTFEQANKEVGEILAQSTPDHEDKAAELEVAINMSLEQSNAETTVCPLHTYWHGGTG
ncbi:hypothetical protein D9758_013717 [Tetrapyrgos nigripes]|uniref:Uncharacterized protein n=1 Tax=Tetrapyrgos nigripes TaxID=182062 RepID=A0A8H5G1P5_9AGAR|nr:hypothetical protein D9758_013717 [Tetrapyrgos nigripes]